LPDDFDPQDARPAAWSPNPKLVLIDPQDVRFQLSACPDTNRLYMVQMCDARGELLAQFSVLGEVDDEIILT
jgi:hypothetical protein